MIFCKKKIEKKIWIFWYQGWNKAPELSKKCLESWIKLNPSWQVNKLSRDNIEDYLDLKSLDFDFDSKSPISCTVDIINLNLLKKYGGVWIDSTVLCLKPLDSWIKKYLKKGFFAYKFNPIANDDGNYRILSTWFLAANKDNYLINKWCEKYNIYWTLRDKPDNYFDFHYLFYELYLKDKKIHKIFNQVPEKNSFFPHYFEEFKSKHIASDLKMKIINSNDYEMAKFQNVLNSTNFQGASDIKKLHPNKYKNHQKETNLSGFDELYQFVIDSYNY
jgi:hypothetical protein